MNTCIQTVKGEQFIMFQSKLSININSKTKVFNKHIKVNIHHAMGRLVYLSH